MINSHLLYRLSYRGTTSIPAPWRYVPASEARHFTVPNPAVNPKNAISDNSLRPARDRDPLIGRPHGIRHAMRIALGLNRRRSARPPPEP